MSAKVCRDKKKPPNPPKTFLTDQEKKEHHRISMQKWNAKQPKPLKPPELFFANEVKRQHKEIANRKYLVEKKKKLPKQTKKPKLTPEEKRLKYNQKTREWRAKQPKPSKRIPFTPEEKRVKRIALNKVYRDKKKRLNPPVPIPRKHRVLCVEPTHAKFGMGRKTCMGCAMMGFVSDYKWCQTCFKWVREQHWTSARHLVDKGILRVSSCIHKNEMRDCLVCNEGATSRLVFCEFANRRFKVNHFGTKKHLGGLCKKRC